MHISLTPELEARVKARVKTGLYNNASEVIREALRFVETHDSWIKELKTAQLKAQLASGINQLDSGQGISVTSSDELDSLFEDLQK